MVDGARQPADRELVLRARQGDKDAFADLVHRHQQSVYAYMLGRTADPERSQEVVQDAFITAYTTLGNLEKPESFRSWVIGIALNVARRRRKEVADIELLGGAQAKGAAGLSRLEHVERIEAVRQGLAELPENYRMALSMHYFDGARGKEIGEALGISEGAVHMVLLRARKALAKSLKAHAPGEEF